MKTLLTRAFGEYFTPESIEAGASFSSTGVALTNLVLRDDVVDALLLNLRVVRAFVGRVEVALPSLLKILSSSEPILVRVERVDVFLDTKLDFSPAEVESRLEAHKRHLLSRHELAKRSHEALAGLSNLRGGIGRAQTQGSTPSLQQQTQQAGTFSVASLAALFLSRLQLRVASVHIRLAFQDARIGLTLETLTLSSRPGHLKNLLLQNLSAYVQFLPAAPPPLGAPPDIAVMASAATTTTDDQPAASDRFVASLDASIVVQPGAKGETLVDANVDHAQIALRVEQAIAIIRAAEAQSRCLILNQRGRRGGATAPDRPLNPPRRAPREWWRYAARRILERRATLTPRFFAARRAARLAYMDLWRKSLEADSTTPGPELLAMEAAHSFDDIVLWRSLAEAELRSSSLSAMQASLPASSTSMMGGENSISTGVAALQRLASWALGASPATQPVDTGSSIAQRSDEQRSDDEDLRRLVEAIKTAPATLFETPLDPLRTTVLTWHVKRLVLALGRVGLELEALKITAHLGQKQDSVALWIDGAHARDLDSRARPERPLISSPVPLSRSVSPRESSPNPHLLVPSPPPRTTSSSPQPIMMPPPDPPRAETPPATNARSAPLCFVRVEVPRASGVPTVIKVRLRRPITLDVSVLTDWWVFADEALDVIGTSSSYSYSFDMDLSSPRLVWTRAGTGASVVLHAKHLRVDDVSKSLSKAHTGMGALQGFHGIRTSYVTVHAVVERGQERVLLAQTRGEVALFMDCNRPGSPVWFESAPVDVVITPAAIGVLTQLFFVTPPRPTAKRDTTLGAGASSLDATMNTAYQGEDDDDDRDDDDDAEERVVSGGRRGRDFRAAAAAAADPSSDEDTDETDDEALMRASLKRAVPNLVQPFREKINVSGVAGVSETSKVAPRLSVASVSAMVVHVGGRSTRWVPSGRSTTRADTVTSVGRPVDGTGPPHPPVPAHVVSWFANLPHGRPRMLLGRTPGRAPRPLTEPAPEKSEVDDAEQDDVQLNRDDESTDSANGGDDEDDFDDFALTAAAESTDGIHFDSAEHHPSLLSLRFEHLRAAFDYSPSPSVDFRVRTASIRTLETDGTAVLADGMPANGTDFLVLVVTPARERHARECRVDMAGPIKLRARLLEKMVDLDMDALLRALPMSMPSASQKPPLVAAVSKATKSASTNEFVVRIGTVEWSVFDDARTSFKEALFRVTTVSGIRARTTQLNFVDVSMLDGLVRFPVVRANWTMGIPDVSAQMLSSTHTTLAVPIATNATNSATPTATPVPRQASPLLLDSLLDSILRDEEDNAAGLEGEGDDAVSRDRALLHVVIAIDEPVMRLETGRDLVRIRDTVTRLNGLTARSRLTGPSAPPVAPPTSLSPGLVVMLTIVRPKLVFEPAALPPLALRCQLIELRALRPTTHSAENEHAIHRVDGRIVGVEVREGECVLLAPVDVGAGIAIYGDSCLVHTRCSSIRVRLIYPRAAAAASTVLDQANALKPTMSSRPSEPGNAVAYATMVRVRLEFVKIAVDVPSTGASLNLVATGAIVSLNGRRLKVIAQSLTLTAARDGIRAVSVISPNDEDDNNNPAAVHPYDKGIPQLTWVQYPENDGRLATRIVVCRSRFAVPQPYVLEGLMPLMTSSSSSAPASSSGAPPIAKGSWETRLTQVRLVIVDAHGCHALELSASSVCVAPDAFETRELMIWHTWFYSADLLEAAPSRTERPRSPARLLNAPVDASVIITEDGDVVVAIDSEVSFEVPSSLLPAVGSVLMRDYFLPSLSSPRNADPRSRPPRIFLSTGGFRVAITKTSPMQAESNGRGLEFLACPVADPSVTASPVIATFMVRVTLEGDDLVVPFLMALDQRDAVVGLKVSEMIRATLKDKVRGALADMWNSVHDDEFRVASSSPSASSKRRVAIATTSNSNSSNSVVFEGYVRGFVVNIPGFLMDTTSLKETRIVASAENLRFWLGLTESSFRFVVGSAQIDRNDEPFVFADQLLRIDLPARVGPVRVEVGSIAVELRRPEEVYHLWRRLRRSATSENALSPPSSSSQRPTMVGASNVIAFGPLDLHLALGPWIARLRLSSSVADSSWTILPDSWLSWTAQLVLATLSPPYQFVMAKPREASWVAHAAGSIIVYPLLACIAVAEMATRWAYVASGTEMSPPRGLADGIQLTVADLALMRGFIPAPRRVALGLSAALVLKTPWGLAMFAAPGAVWGVLTLTRRVLEALLVALGLRPAPRAALDPSGDRIESVIGNVIVRGDRIERTTIFGPRPLCRRNEVVRVRLSRNERAVEIHIAGVHDHAGRVVTVEFTQARRARRLVRALCGHQ